MEEKKLTDEEIVKALEHCSHNRSCEYCYHNNENGSGEIVCRSRLMLKTLDLIHRLQFENERLTEERDVYLDDCSAVRHKIRQEIEEKFKLQKQVDELTQQYLEESKERCKFEQLYNHKCHEHNIGLGVQRKHWEKKVQQAVKDTAKEILQMYRLEDTFSSFQAKVMEHYGVEVE